MEDAKIKISKEMKDEVESPEEAKLKRYLKWKRKERMRIRLLNDKRILS